MAESTRCGFSMLSMWCVPRYGGRRQSPEEGQDFRVTTCLLRGDIFNDGFKGRIGDVSKTAAMNDAENAWSPDP